MNAAETLQAAIVRLEGLRRSSTPGPWLFTFNRSGTHAIYGERPGQEVIGATNRYGGLWDSTDGRLIVTLHRTIDAQLAMLSIAVQDIRIAGEEDARIMWPLELRLAEAILGGTE